MLVDRKEYAKIRGCSYNSITAKIKHGLQIEHDGKIDTRKAIEWEISYVAGNTPAEARTRKDNATAEKTELEIKRLKKQLLPVEDVEAFLANTILKAKSKLLNLPTKLSTIALACETLQECENKTRALVEECLDELTFEDYLPTTEKTERDSAGIVAQAPDPFSQ